MNVLRSQRGAQRNAGRVRWRVAGACAMGTLGMLLSVGLLAPAGAAAAECPYPGNLNENFNATLSEGALTIGKHAAATGVSGTQHCLVLYYHPPQEVEVAAGNTSYNTVPLKVDGLGMPAEATLSATDTAEGEWANVFGGPNGEVEGTSWFFTSPVNLTIKTDGDTCSDPINPTLTTGKSGSLEGQILKGPLFGPSGIEGPLVANEFGVPAIQQSSTCPATVAARLNAAIGLPLAPGASSIKTKYFAVFVGA